MRQLTVYAGLDGIALGEATARTLDIARWVLPASVETEMAGASQLMTESFGHMPHDRRADPRGRARLQ